MYVFSFSVFVHFFPTFPAFKRILIECLLSVLFYLCYWLIIWLCFICLEIALGLTLYTLTYRCLSANTVITSLMTVYFCFSIIIKELKNVKKCVTFTHIIIHIYPCSSITLYSFVLVQISICYDFPLAWRTSCIISCSIRSVGSFLSFCLFEKSVYFTPIFQEYFCWCFQV